MSFIRFKRKPLELLKENGWTQGKLRREKIFAGSTIDKLRECTVNVPIETLGKVAYYANVDITDIVEIIKEEREEHYGKKNRYK